MNMNRKDRSIDGLSRRSTGAEVPRRAVGGVVKKTEKIVRRIPVSEAPAAAPRKKTVASDVDAFLSSVQDVDVENFVSVPEKSHKEVRKDRKRAAKRERKAERKKKKHTVRNVILIVIGLILLGVGGVAYYMGHNILGTIGDIFNGEVIDIFTKKERLAEDADGWSNVLIFGTSGFEGIDETSYDGGQLADSIMVLSVNQTSKEAFMMSLPRDLYVKHKCPSLGTSAGKLNETFYCNYAAKTTKKDEAIAAAYFMEVAGGILGLDVQYYLHLDWTALANAVNAVDGVDVLVESSDKRGIYDVSTGLKLPNGISHLDGWQALSFARARGSEGGYGLAGGNFDRELHQQQVIKALQEKALSSGTLTNPTRVVELVNSFGDNHLRTNVKTSEIQTLIDLALGIKMEAVQSIPFVSAKEGVYYFKTGSVGAASVVLPNMAGEYDYSKIQAYVKSFLVSDPVSTEKASVNVLNATGVSGAAAKEAERLQDAGFEVNQVYNAPEGFSAETGTTVYRKTLLGTAGTTTALEKFYKVEAVGIVPAEISGSGDADFYVVIGKD
ncbi:hypothetical protein FACS1894191_5800 [Clostridia bacterium]|nr:hypothetical protein FACS1894191_5800 [Clostridia bacterium]